MLWGQSWVQRGTRWGHRVGIRDAEPSPILQLSETCFEDFTTSPYEMLVLVRQFFQDIKQLLHNKETFEKDCSQVYRSACAGPQQRSSSPGTALPAAPPAQAHLHGAAWSRVCAALHTCAGAACRRVGSCVSVFGAERLLGVEGGQKGGCSPRWGGEWGWE